MSLGLDGRPWSVAAALVLTSMLAVSGCASSDEASSDGAGSSTAAGPINIGNGKITPKNTKRIAFVSGSAETFAYTKAQAQGVKAAAKKAGYDVDTYYANYDPAAELANIRQVMTSGKYGGVIYTPGGGPQACKLVASGALTAKILVVMNAATLCGENTAAPEGNWSPGTAQFVGGASLIDGYKKCLDSAAKVAPGPQKVLLVQGTQTSPSSVGLKTAWDSVAKKHPDWTLADQVFTDFTAPTSYSTVQNALQSSKDKDVTLVLNNYVEIAAGAAKAVSAQNLKGKVKVMDVGGGSKQDVTLIQSGDLFSTCPTYPYSIGEKSVETLAAAFNGTQPAKVVLDDGQSTPLAMVTKSDLSSFKPQW